jgi:glutamate 5-kinase
MLLGSRKLGHVRGVPKSQIAQLYGAVGQPILYALIESFFNLNGRSTAQCLLSRNSFANRLEYFSIRDTIRNAITADLVPVVNDNDMLHSELAGFRVNDQIAAYLGGMLNADSVIFLTDEPGIFETYPPPADSNPIGLIDDSLGAVLESVWGSNPPVEIKNQLRAAKLLYDLGIPVYIRSGGRRSPIVGALEGHDDEGTAIVPPKQRKLSGVRKWLCTGAVPRGSLFVSPLGAEAIRRQGHRGSLLARGIVRLSGDFSEGDVVSVCDEQGQLLGYGISKLASTELMGRLGEEHLIAIHADYFYGTDFGYF